MGYTCTNCGSDNIILKNGLLKCSACGQIKDDSYQSDVENGLINARLKIEEFDFLSANEAYNRLKHLSPNNEQIYLGLFFSNNQICYIRADNETAFPFCFSDSIKDDLKNDDNLKNALLYSKNNKEWINNQVSLIEQQGEELKKLKFNRINVYIVCDSSIQEDCLIATELSNKLYEDLKIESYVDKYDFSNKNAKDVINGDSAIISPKIQAEIQNALNTSSFFIVVASNKGVFNNIKISTLVNVYNKKIELKEKSRNTLIILTNSRAFDRVDEISLKDARTFNTYNNGIGEIVNFINVNKNLLSYNDEAVLGTYILKRKCNDIEPKNAAENFVNNIESINNNVINLKTYTGETDESKKEKLNNLILLTKSYLDNENYSNALSELKNYFDSCKYYGTKQEPSLIILNLYALYKTNNNDSLLNLVSINDKNESYFSDAIKMLEIGDETSEIFLNDCVSFVEKELINGNPSNAYKIYKHIYNINIEKIKNLSRKIFSSLKKIIRGLRYNEEPLLYSFIDLAITSLKYEDKIEYSEETKKIKSIDYLENIKNFLGGSILDLIKGDYFDEAKYLNNILKEKFNLFNYDPSYISYIEFLIDNHVHFEEELLSTIEHDRISLHDFDEKVIKQSPAKLSYINLLKKRLIINSNEKNNKEVLNLSNCLIGQKFDDYTKTFINVLKNSITNYDEYTYEIYDLICNNALSENERNVFIEESLRLSEISRRQNNFDSASKTISNLLNYEPKNKDIIKESIRVNSKSIDKNIDIAKLDNPKNSIEYIKKMDNDLKIEFVCDILYYSLENFEKKPVDKKTDELLYKNSDLFFKLLIDEIDYKNLDDLYFKYSETYLHKGYFKISIDYAKRIIQIDKTPRRKLHQAYFNLLLAEYGVQNERDIVFKKGFEKNNNLKQAIIISSKLQSEVWYRDKYSSLKYVKIKN